MSEWELRVSQTEIHRMHVVSRERKRLRDKAEQDENRSRFERCPITAYA